MSVEISHTRLYLQLRLTRRWLFDSGNKLFFPLGSLHGRPLTEQAKFLDTSAPGYHLTIGDLCNVGLLEERGLSMAAYPSYEMMGECGVGFWAPYSL